MSWLIVTCEAAREAALKLARGCYQRALLSGRESLSGSTLAGRAAGYIGRYRASRDNLLNRLDANGVEWNEVRGPHGRRILVLGPLPPAAEAVTRLNGVVHKVHMEVQ